MVAGTGTAATVDTGSAEGRLLLQPGF